MNTIWYTRCPVPTASGVAIDTGILEAAFVTKEIAIRSLTQSAMAEAHFNHSLPALFREGGNVPALWARSRGERTRLLGLVSVPEFQAVLAPAGSGLRGAAALRGRRLIIPAHSGDRVDFFRAMAMRGFDSALRSAGLALQDCEIVEVSSSLPQLTDIGAEGFYGSSVRALEAGIGDVIYVKGSPGADVLTAGGLEVVVELTALNDPMLQINNGTPRTLTVSEELVSLRPDDVVTYVAALQHAAVWAGAHPRETAEIVARDTGSTLAGVGRGYGDDMHRRLRVELRPEWIAHLQDQKAFLLEHGVLEEDFGIDDWIDPRPLELANQLIKSDRQKERVG